MIGRLARGYGVARPEPFAPCGGELARGASLPAQVYLTPVMNSEDLMSCLQEARG